MGKEALLFGAVAHSEDVGVAGPGVLVNNYGALCVYVKARFLGKNAVRPYAKAKDNEVGSDLFAVFKFKRFDRFCTQYLFYLCILPALPEVQAAFSLTILKISVAYM